MKAKNNKRSRDKKIKEIISDEKQITEILQRAIHETVKNHKLAGNSLAGWKDGKAVLIKSEKENPIPQ